MPRPARPEAQLRLELLGEYRAEARAAYDRSIAAGIIHPVVMIVDTQDEAGRRIVEGSKPLLGQAGASSRVVLVVSPLGPLLEEGNVLPASSRRALEETTRAGGTPNVHIVIVIAHGGSLCMPVPLNL